MGVMRIRFSGGRMDGTQMAVSDRSPSRAFYLTWIGNVEGNVNGWGIQLQPLEMDHAREFFVAFGSHYFQWIAMESTFQGGKYRLRAYVKNGRRSDWTISIESCA